MEVSSAGTALLGQERSGMVQIWPAESGGKSWLKEISTGKPAYSAQLFRKRRAAQAKTPPSVRESGVLFDRDT